MNNQFIYGADGVAPLVGAWIEMFNDFTENAVLFVAPLVGAWIEIEMKRVTTCGVMSLPSWERGLKSQEV